MLTLEARDVMRENAHNLVAVLIQEDIPFRLVLWTEDDWDVPLPVEVIEAFPNQIVLDIADLALRDSHIDEMTGDIVITTLFYGEEYSKILAPEEIIAILDLEGQPYILNSFAPEKQKIYTFTDAEKITEPKTKENMVTLVSSEGIPKDIANRSVSAFVKHNPNLFRK